MKCEVTSNTTHGVLISKDISFKSYKEICSGEKKKVNLGWNPLQKFKIENNTLVNKKKTEIDEYIHGAFSNMVFNLVILSKFFATYNIEPNWLDCNNTYGWYDEELGGWTGCVGKV